MTKTLTNLIVKETFKQIKEKTKLVYFHQLTIDEKKQMDSSGAYDFVMGDGLNVLETSAVALCASVAHAMIAIPIFLTSAYKGHQTPKKLALELGFVALPWITNASTYLISFGKNIYRNAKNDFEKKKEPR